MLKVGRTEKGYDCLRLYFSHILIALQQGKMRSRTGAHQYNVFGETIFTSFVQQETDCRFDIIFLVWKLMKTIVEKPVVDIGKCISRQAFHQSGDIRIEFVFIAPCPSAA